jgi:hypothetical protein
MFCTPGIIFDGTKGVWSQIHVLCSRTCFRRSRRPQVPFSCFVLPCTFSEVQRASGPVYMFCPLGRILGGTEGVGSRFHVLRSRTRFWRYRGRQVPFSWLAILDSFRRYRGRQVPFSCFARPESFPAVPRASGSVFIFCAPGLIFGGTEGVGCCFPVLRARSLFPRFLGRRVPFS